MSNRPPIVGQERSKLADLAEIIRRENPTWATREKIAAALALAQMECGPYAARWIAMRGPKDWRPNA